MKSNLPVIIAAIGIVAPSSHAIAADHGHLNVGAVGTSQNDALNFDNGALFDTSTAYSSSEVLKIYFQAGVSIKSLQKSNGTATVTFGGRLNRNYVLQTSRDLGEPARWIDASDAMAGNDAFVDVVDVNATAPAMFYRIKDVTP